MTDPIYDYIPGQGWVVAPPYLTSEVFNLRDDTRVRLVFRKPTGNEYYDCAGLHSRRWFNEDGTPKIDAWVASYRNYNIGHLCVWEPRYEYSPEEGYVVVEVLND